MAEERVSGNIADVAREAGVSLSTASRAIRGSSHVLPETRQKVLAAAERLGYHPNAMARLLRTGDTRTVALVVTASQVANILYATAIASLRTMLPCRELRLTVSVAGDCEDAQQSLEELLSWCRVLVLPREFAKDPARLRKRGSSVVILDETACCGPPLAGLSSICFDPAQGIALAVRQLAASGHRNIAYFGSPSHPRHEEGYRLAMQEACLPVRPEWVLACDPVRIAESTAAAYGQATKSSRCRLTAAVCACDEIALGLSAAVRHHHGDVPDQLSITGYGNSEAARLASPSLTTIEHRGEDLGEALARMVLRHCSDPTAVVEQVLLPARLIVRDSTAPCAGVPAPLSHQASGVLADGIYELRALNSGMALDLSDRNKVAGSAVCQRSPVGATAQLWHVCHAGDNWYTIRNVRTWLYLDAVAHAPGTVCAEQNPRNEVFPTIQLWRFDPVTGEQGVYQITNKAKDLVLDVARSAQFDCTLVLVYRRKAGEDAKNQKWRAVPVPFAPGEYELVTLHTSKALDVPHGSRAAGTVPCQADRARTLGQRWRLRHQGGGIYRIENMLCNLQLQISQLPRPAVTLEPNDPDAGDTQLWKLEPADPERQAYRIVSCALGKVLEVGPDGRTETAAAGIADWTGAAHQQWLIYSDQLS